MLKRLFDVLCALLSLIILSPALIIIGALVWISDPGPIIFKGMRVGRNGALFHILKFRTMRVRPHAGAAVTVRNDPRITPVGRELRKLKLDELPQLFNVLRGDMSFVGPRPEAPVYVALYTPAQRQILRVRPGITGLTQIVYRDESELLAGSNAEWVYRTVAMPAKLRIDQLYIEKQTLWLDLRILALTAAAIVYPPSAVLASRLVKVDALNGDEAQQIDLKPVLNEPIVTGSKDEHYG